MFTVTLISVDGFRKTKTYKTIAAARKFAVNYVGETPEFGCNYAVSADGVATIYVDGCTLNQLFGVVEPKDVPFGVYVYIVNEDRGTTSKFLAKSFATLEEALACINSDEFDLYDGTDIVGATEAAKDVITAYRKARVEAINAEVAKNFDNDFPF